MPTRNRRLMLTALIESLSHQECASDRFELIVVDNESSDGTAEAVRELAGRVDFLLRYERVPNRGPAPARNRGAQLASGNVVAFTDSDCAARPGWLAAGVAAFAEDPELALASGPILPMGGVDDPLAELPLLTRTMHSPVEDPFYPTANVFYRTEIFNAMGGFPEDYPFNLFGQLMGGDDIELAWRVKRTGLPYRFLPAAVVEHAVHRQTLKQWLKYPFLFGTMGLIVRRVPELRRQPMLLRVLVPFNGAHWFKLVLVALPLAFLRPYALLLALPFYAVWLRVYRADLVRPWRWPRLGGRVAAWTAYNLLLTAVLVGSSIRYRTIVL